MFYAENIPAKCNDGRSVNDHPQNRPVSHSEGVTWKRNRFTDRALKASQVYFLSKSPVYGKLPSLPQERATISDP